MQHQKENIAVDWQAFFEEIIEEDDQFLMQEWAVFYSNLKSECPLRSEKEAEGYSRTLLIKFHDFVQATFQTHLATLPTSFFNLCLKLIGVPAEEVTHLCGLEAIGDDLASQEQYRLWEHTLVQKIEKAVGTRYRLFSQEHPGFNTGLSHLNLNNLP